MNLRIPDPKRGSALLIVLGLLGFLMISAVAFSISMRTERAAAATFRTDVRTRDLLAMAFADARATVEGALAEQLGGADPARNPEQRTVERLTPFRIDDDNYARLISSRTVASSTSGADGNAMAYILDDAAMAHVPPYVAAKVFAALEPGYGTTASSTGRAYAFDEVACWRPVYASVPETDVEVDGQTFSRTQTLVGRMAWAVVNLSDSVDINGIGSFSPYRGLGLTGSEFAFGRTASAPAGLNTYDLVEASEDEKGVLSPELPVFLSNADLYAYSSMTDEGNLKAEGPGSILSYAWQDAALYSGDGSGYYAPFSVYSFWPSDRKNEDGDLIETTGETASAPSCDEIRAEDLTPGSELANRIEQALSTVGVSDGSGLRDNFLRLLTDYIDTDSVPNALDLRTGGDEYANAAPTVENVPMVMEVGYDASETDGRIADAIKSAVEALSATVTTTKENAERDLTFCPEPLTVALDGGTLSLPVSARAYFPGFETASTEAKGAVLAGEGYLAVSAVAAADGSAPSSAETASAELSAEFGSAPEAVYDTDPVTAELTASGSLSPLTFEAGTIPVQIPAEVEGLESPQEIKVTMTVLVDYLVRMRTEGEGIHDLAPASPEGRPDSDFGDAVPSLGDRLNATKMLPYDRSYFRVTRAFQVVFRPAWEVEPQTDSEGAVTGYKATLKVDVLSEPAALTQAVQVAVSDGATVELSPASANGDAALSFAPPQGVWKTVDPRYNWISPMLGSTGSAEDYGTEAQAAYTSYSSPHWFFLPESPESARNVLLGQSYAETPDNAASVPFKFALSWDEIRYGVNDTGRLYLPGEIGFLPVPFRDSDWTPGATGYNKTDLGDYYRRVARPSYFRTLPVSEFDDGAFSGCDVWNEENAVKLASMFRRFAAPGFPEEHRAIMSAFAAQDNYALAQRLRQFALCGIMPTIREAVAVSRARLETAQDAGRTKIEDFDEVFPKLEDVTLGTPKYDTFICKYLFPLPGEEAPGSGISAAGDNETWPAGTRPNTVDFFADMGGTTGSANMADRLKAYNEAEGAGDRLGQNDLTTILSVAGECFGDRQQLFLYILRADTVASRAGFTLGSYRPLATARAVALVWRDAYGLLPDRVVYYQVLP